VGLIQTLVGAGVEAAAGAATKKVKGPGPWTPFDAPEGGIRIYFPGQPGKPRSSSFTSAFGKARMNSYIQLVAYDGHAMTPLTLGIIQFPVDPQSPQAVFDEQLAITKKQSGKWYDIRRTELFWYLQYPAAEIDLAGKGVMNMDCRIRYVYLGPRLVQMSASWPTDGDPAKMSDIQQYMNSLQIAG